jgi:alanine racemase
MLNRKIHQATQAIIDLSAIQHNLGLVRRIVGPKVKIMAAVKADAYGHGIVEVSRIARQSGAEWLGVGSAWEGKHLREAGIDGPILVLGPTLARESPLIITYRLSQVISSGELAEALSAEAQRQDHDVGIHLKVDSGMGRLGIRPEEALPICGRLRRLTRLRFEGLMTHFAVAHQRDKGFTRAQLESFQRTAQTLEQEGFHFPLRHAANSAAIIDLPESHLDMVRPGIMLYGHFPSAEVSHELRLRPALTFRTEIGHLKSLQPGESVSYGRLFIAPRQTRVAILPVGYADGYHRGLSHQAFVLVHGQSAPVIGVICMNMTAVDVTDIPEASVGDEIVLFGRQGNAEVSAEQVANWLNTIPYEVLTSIGRRVERIYVPSPDASD